MLTQFRISVLGLFQTNLLKIAAALIITLVFYLIFYLSTASLKKLKTDIFSSYPFGLFFPEASTWSIGYFLLAILGFGILIYFMLQGKFLAGPA